jgi:hypothetical protein
MGSAWNLKEINMNSQSCHRFPTGFRVHGGTR